MNKALEEEHKRLAEAMAKAREEAGELEAVAFAGWREHQCEPELAVRARRVVLLLQESQASLCRAMQEAGKL